MQNFTEEIKNEITSMRFSNEAVLEAMLSAFIRTSGSVVSKKGWFGFEIITENERTAEFFSELLEEKFGLSLTVSGAKFDLMSGKDKLSFECVNEKTDILLQKLGIIESNKEGKILVFEIKEGLVSDYKSKIGYIMGAFLGGGSCTLPDEGIYSSTGYHFEIIFSHKRTAGDFAELLSDLEILAKLVSRQEANIRCEDANARNLS